MNKLVHYLALLRGINVGGNNIIKMSDLRSCFEGMGFGDVATYIQSGNVIFTSSGQDMDALTITIETTFSNQFCYISKVVLVSHRELAKIVADAPRGFGSDKERYRYDVIFLKPPLTAQEAFREIGIKDGVDEVQMGKGVLYFRRLTGKIGQSRLSKLVVRPIYKNMTIRNWNTTTKLCVMMDARK